MDNITLDLRPVLLALALGMAILPSACPDDSKITDCSSRGRPMHRDADGNWTCRQ